MGIKKVDNFRKIKNMQYPNAKTVTPYKQFIHLYKKNSQKQNYSTQLKINAQVPRFFFQDQKKR